MSTKNVTIGTTDYTGVDKVQLKETGEETYVDFVETSDGDAVAGDIADGKFAYVDGVKIEGTAATLTKAATPDIYDVSPVGGGNLEVTVTNNSTADGVMVVSCDNTQYGLVEGSGDVTITVWYSSSPTTVSVTFWSVGLEQSTTVTQEHNPPI